MPWTKGNGPPNKFRPGQSSNPSGRPKKMPDLVELAKQHTAEAITRIVQLMRQTKDDELALAAAVELMNRGWGKPPVAVLAQVSATMMIGGIDRPPNNGETMAQWLERRRRELQALEALKPPTIDAIALQPEPRPPSEEQPPSEEPEPPLFWPKPPQR